MGCGLFAKDFVEPFRVEPDHDFIPDHQCRGRVAVVFFGQLAHGGSISGNVPLLKSSPLSGKNSFDDWHGGQSGWVKRITLGFMFVNECATSKNCQRTASPRESRFRR